MYNNPKAFSSLYSEYLITNLRPLLKQVKNDVGEENLEDIQVNLGGLIAMMVYYFAITPREATWLVGEDQITKLSSIITQIIDSDAPFPEWEEHDREWIDFNAHALKHRKRKENLKNYLSPYDQYFNNRDMFNWQGNIDNSEGD